MSIIKILFKWMTILIVLCAFSIYGLNYYNDYKNKNEWNMEYKNSNPPSCEISSNYIEGNKLVHSYLIMDSDFFSGDKQNVNRYSLFTIGYIKIDSNIIKTNKCTLIINGEEKDFEASWDGDLQCYQIIDNLENGNDVVLKLMKTDGEPVHIKFKANDSFSEKNKKCKSLIEEKIAGLNKEFNLANLKKHRFNNNKYSWIEIENNIDKIRLLDGNWIKIPPNSKLVDSNYVLINDSKTISTEELIEKMGYNYIAMKKAGYTYDEIMEALSGEIFSKGEAFEFINNLKEKALAEKDIYIEIALIPDAQKKKEIAKYYFDSELIDNKFKLLNTTEQENIFNNFYKKEIEDAIPVFDPNKPYTEMK